MTLGGEGTLGHKISKAGKKKMSKAKISCIFKGGMAIKDYDFKEYEITKFKESDITWLVIIDDDNAKSYINLNNVNMFSMYEVKENEKL